MPLSLYDRVYRVEGLGFGSVLFVGVRISGLGGPLK